MLLEASLTHNANLFDELAGIGTPACTLPHQVLLRFSGSSSLTMRNTGTGILQFTGQKFYLFIPSFIHF